MVGGHAVVQNGKTETQPGFVKPLHPPLPVASKLQQEFPLMAAMRQMPYLYGNKMPMSACHGYGFSITPILRSKMQLSRLFYCVFGNNHK